MALITLIGVLDANGYTAYVHGENLANFREAMEQYDLVVTFNGAAFDLPYIKHHFGSICIPEGSAHRPALSTQARGLIQAG